MTNMNRATFQHHLFANLVVCGWLTICVVALLAYLVAEYVA